jgi:hypothetical protein
VAAVPPCPNDHHRELARLLLGRGEHRHVDLQSHEGLSGALSRNALATRRTWACCSWTFATSSSDASAPFFEPGGACGATLLIEGRAAVFPTL